LHPEWIHVFGQTLFALFVNLRSGEVDGVQDGCVGEGKAAEEEGDEKEESENVTFLASWLVEGESSVAELIGTK